jgi:hypothetical protein
MRASEYMICLRPSVAYLMHLRCRCRRNQCP